MISLLVIRAILRRWYILLAGLVITLGVFLLVNASSQVYQSETTVVFVSPGNADIGQVNVTQTDSLVAFAFTVERQVNDNRPIYRLSSAYAPIFGVGVRKGYQVAVPNIGGQWNNYYPYPQLLIQVVGPSRAWVQATQSRLLSEIQRYTHDDQARLRIKHSRWISAQVSPSTGGIQYAGGSKSMKLRGLLALLFVGTCASATIATLADRAILRRKDRDGLDLRRPGNRATGEDAPHITDMTLTRPQRGPSL